MYLFSNISYRLSSQEIESVHHPGQAATMLGLLKYSDNFSSAQCLNQLWKIDTATTAVLADNTGLKARQSYLIASPTVKGTFSFRVPLKLPSVLLARRTKKILEKNEKFMSWGESFQNRLQLNSHVFHYTDCHVYFVFAYCVFFVYYVVCVFTATISLMK